MFEWLGISLVLAALLSINAFASMLAASLWRVIDSATSRWSSHTRARILFAMRVGPPALSVCVVFGLVIPAYLIHEPRASGEIVSGKLATLALISMFGVALAVWRGLRSWIATRTLLRQWLAGAQPIHVTDVDVPAFIIDHPFPVIAVVGWFQPKLFIARKVLDSLSEEELLAALAHESGHLEAHDNLRRTLIRACKDILTIVPCGRSLDRAWAENAEAAADESAATRGSAVALNLASALIEIARMVPAGGRPTMPIASFLLGNEIDGVKGRVRRLLDLAGGGVHQVQGFSKLARWLTRSAFATSFVILVLVLIRTSALSEMHDAIEQVVRILS
jgi:Zn-dependent protease with chaperone function